MQGLAEFAGCTVDEAVLLHAGIHIAEFPGILALVTELHANGIRTGCLSNINEPHWSFVSSSRYPGVAAIQMKMASFLVELSKPSPAIFDNTARPSDWSRNRSCSSTTALPTSRQRHLADGMRDTSMFRATLTPNRGTSPRVRGPLGRDRLSCRRSAVSA